MNKRYTTKKKTKVQKIKIKDAIDGKPVVSKEINTTGKIKKNFSKNSQ